MFKFGKGEGWFGSKQEMSPEERQKSIRSLTLEVIENIEGHARLETESRVQGENFGSYYTEKIDKAQAVVKEIKAKASEAWKPVRDTETEIERIEGLEPLVKAGMAKQEDLDNLRRNLQENKQLARTASEEASKVEFAGYSETDTLLRRNVVGYKGGSLYVPKGLTPIEAKARQEQKDFAGVMARGSRGDNYFIAVEETLKSRGETDKDLKKDVTELVNLIMSGPKEDRAAWKEKLAA